MKASAKQHLKTFKNGEPLWLSGKVVKMRK
jgi:hypothetical protein